jgi:hypothetical protein
MVDMGTLIGRTAMDHTVITGARFMGLMATVVCIPIITAAGFRRRLLHLHHGLLSLRDSKKADDDWVECGARTHSDSFPYGCHSEALLSECEHRGTARRIHFFDRLSVPALAWCSDTFDAIIDRV